MTEESEEFVESDRKGCGRLDIPVLYSLENPFPDKGGLPGGVAPVHPRPIRGGFRISEAAKALRAVSILCRGFLQEEQGSAGRAATP